MKKLILFFIIAFVAWACCVSIGDASSPLPKWQKTSGAILNKTADSLGVLCGTDTLWFSKNDTLLELISQSGTVFAVDTSGNVYFRNYKFPLADGANGQYLATNGSGTLSFTSPGGGSGFWSEVDSMLYWDGGNATTSDSSFIIEANGTNDEVVVRTDLSKIRLQSAGGMNYADSFTIGKMYLVWDNGGTPDTVAFDASDIPVDGYALIFNSGTGFVEFQEITAATADSSEFTKGVRRVGVTYAFAAGQMVLDTVNNRLRVGENISTSHYFNNTTSNNAQFYDVVGDSLEGDMDVSYFIMEFGKKDSIYFDTTGTGTDSTGAFKFTDDIHSLYGDDNTGGNVAGNGNFVIRLNNTIDAQGRLYFGINGSNITEYLQFDPATDEFTLTKGLNTSFVDVDTVFLGNDTLVQDNIPAYLVRARVRNGTGATLLKGTPVYLTGSAVGNIPNVDSARADNASMMPALGVLEHDIGNGQQGNCVIMGEVSELNTLAFSVGDELYVAPTGGLTATKPTGDDKIQKIGIVSRDSETVGIVDVIGAGRSNDVPNINTGQIWIGSIDSVATARSLSGDATIDSTGVVTVVDDSHNHVITNIDAFTKAQLETQTSDVSDYAEADGDTWTGVHDMGGATSFEVPNGVNPTTDAEGEIAYDTDDDALEVYDGTRSVLIPSHRTIQFNIIDPAGITDTIPIWEADSFLVQNGIVITNVSFLTDVDEADTLFMYSYTSADPPILHDYVDSLTKDATDQFGASATFADIDAQTVDVGQRIYIRTNASSTATWMKVKIRYYIKDNN